jgi:autotransporter-associated beta strand protein
MSILKQGRTLRVLSVTTLVWLVAATFCHLAHGQRLLGIDVSAWQSEISVSDWATLKRLTTEQVNGIYGDGRDFVFVRATRGGTSGYYNQNDDDNGNGLNTLSQRYDDPYFVQNITRATAAGMYAGPYHFARLDVVASTFNSGGIPNNGVDEANHMIEMAGPWIRPGYLLPVFDLEAGFYQRSADEIATFCVEFADRMDAVTGVRPFMYINGLYANAIQTSSIPQAVVSAFPKIWIARYANQSDPNSIPIQTGHPKDTFTPIYGPWDDSPLPSHPWSVWQYASTARLNGYRSGTANIDVNVAQGGFEFLKDLLVPALWISNSNGQWTTTTNWNSGITAVAPVQGPGQVPRVGPMTLPAPRLPSSIDTVILDRPNTNVVVTLSSGSHNIRKLFVRETLEITGGSLFVGYFPIAESTPFSAQFSGPVFLGGTGVLTIHTLQVDAGQTFILAGGTMRFKSINLMRDGVAPAKIAIAGTATFNGVGTTTPVITNESSGVSAYIDLTGGSRTLNVPSGQTLAIEVPFTNGGMIKSGAGAIRLGTASSHTGGTTVSAGRLLLNANSGSATGSGFVTVNNGGTLCGTGLISGVVTVNSGGTLLPGTETMIGTLTLDASPTLNGTTFMKIGSDGGVVGDKIVRSGGSLNYGGTLVVSNMNASLVGGEVFTNFSAAAYSGAFTSSNMPALDVGLNWYVGSLTNDGTIRVNRKPVANLLTLTNDPTKTLQIALATLLSNSSDPDGDVMALQGIGPVSTNGIVLVTNGSFIVYSNGVNVADEFSYTISDGRGGTATGKVRIVPSATGRFARPLTAVANSITMHLAGRPGSAYFIERSTNLSTWDTITTNIAPEPNGLFNYVDTFYGLPGTPAAAYYRLRWLE